MDDLVANLPHLVLRSSNAESIDLIQGIRRLNVRELIEKRRNEVQLPKKDDKRTKKYQNLRLRNALQNLMSIQSFIATGSLSPRQGENSSTPASFLSSFLREAVTEIQDIHHYPAMFETVELGETFFKHALQLLRSIARLNEAWRTYEEVKHQVEDESREADRAMDERDNAKNGRTLWTTWCRNRIELPCVEDSKEAHVSKGPATQQIVTSRSYLPRGALWVLEHMRNDVKGIVQPLLDIRNSKPLRDQLPTTFHMYNYSICIPEKGADRATAICLIDIPDKTIFASSSGSSSLTDLARLASRLEKVRDGTVRGTYFVVRRECELSRSRFEAQVEPPVSEEFQW